MQVSISTPSGTLIVGNSYNFSVSLTWGYYENPKAYNYNITFTKSDGTTESQSDYSISLSNDFWDTSLSVGTFTVPANTTSCQFYFEMDYCVNGGSYWTWTADTKNFSAYTPIPTVAPKDFKAAQDGKHIAFTWTAGSGDGTMTYLVIDGDVAPPGCSRTTATSSTCSDCSSYYNKSVTWYLMYYLDGSVVGSLTYTSSVVTPSVSATITITQASKSKQVTVSWNGSCSGFTATSKNFKISCSGSSGYLYDGSGSSSVSYTPPTYGTSYRYTNVFTASNTYGDSFSVTVYKDFTATAPYYTVGVYISGDWTPCVAYVYRDGWKECHPYVYRDGWKLCDYA